MNELGLFAGAGGGLLASKLLKWNTIGAVEIEKYPREILLQRQRDGILEKFPIWDDVRTFDGKPWRGLVDIISGGFPCQDISSAGTGKGLEGERSGLWFEFARIIKEIKPKFAFIENSPLLRIRGLEVVLQGLAEMGYDARWCTLGYRHISGCHRRDRMFILAHSNNAGVQRLQSPRSISSFRPRGMCRSTFLHAVKESPYGRCASLPQPLLCRGDDGLSKRVDRIKAIGNAQVPSVAATAWSILSYDLCTK